MKIINKFGEISNLSDWTLSVPKGSVNMFDKLNNIIILLYLNNFAIIYSSESIY